METICELRGFIDSYTSDNVVIVGDFNVDFQSFFFPNSIAVFNV